MKIVPSIWRNVPGTGLYFLTLSHLKYLALVSSQRWPVCGETLVEKRPNGAVVISPFGNVLLGSTARVGAGFVLMPMTIVKVRFEVTLCLAYSSAA